MRSGKKLLRRFSNDPPAEPEALTAADPSKGPYRRREKTPHPFTPSPLFPLPGEREEGEGSCGEGSCRNGEITANADSRNRQTPTATPAEPGVLLREIVFRPVINRATY